MSGGWELDPESVFDRRDVTGCRGSTCSARIAWALTEQKKRQPVDPNPVPDGILIVEAAEVGSAPGDVQNAHLYRSRVETLLDPEGPRYMPHHATCPDAPEFRK